MKTVSQERQQTIFIPALQNITERADDYHERVREALSGRRIVLENALERLMEQASVLTDIAVRLVDALQQGHKVLVAGNGGSAAEAQHFATELVGRFKREREAYAALALTADTAALTAIANDYGYQHVFARQVSALGQPGDILVIFSTSGESENLLNAAREAHKCPLTVVAITGNRHSRLENLADITVRVPVVDSAAAQELHMVITHILCDIVEAQLSGKGDGRAQGHEERHVEKRRKTRLVTASQAAKEERA